MKANRFLVFEGLSATGKSTIGNIVAERIGAQVYKTPGPLFGSIREGVDVHATIEARYLYYVASVVQSSHDIAKILETSSVVCDRYILTTVCWHRVMGVDIARVESFATEHLVEPDFTFLITCDEKKRLARLEKRGMTVNDRIELESGRAERFLAEYRKRPVVEIDNSTEDVEEAVAKILEYLQ